MSGRRAPPRNAIRDNHNRRHNPYPHAEPPSRQPFNRPRPPLHPDIYEEEIDNQMGEIRRLDTENRRLNDDRLALQRHLTVAQEEIHRLNLVIVETRAERDERVREMIEKGRKMEADIRAGEGFRNEVLQLRAEVKNLDVVRQDQLKNLTQDLERAQMEAKSVKGFKNEIEGLRQELVRARTAFEYEKKGNADMMEQRQLMEKNMVSMAREIEKLQSELASGKSRSWGGSVYDARSYDATLNSPEGGYPSSYGNGYGLLVGAGEKNPVYGVGEKNPAYGVGSGSWASYDKSHPAHR